MRTRLLPSLLAATVLALAACSSGGADTAAEQSTAAAVTFTHPTLSDLEIPFEEQPDVLVMDCYAYSSLHEYGVEPDALFGFDCENPFVMGDIDISGIERIGQDGEIDVEELAALRPDAIIGQGGAEGWSWFDESVNAQLTRVAPFIPLPEGETVDEEIDATRDIAGFLGGDIGSEAVTQADADLEAAKEELRSALEGEDLSIMLASPTKEMLYTAVGFQQSALLEEAGATIVGGERPAEGNPWGQVAWEEASSHPADVILIEGYDEHYSFTADLWEELPAVQADQLGSWGSKGAMTSRAYADWLTEVTALVQSADDVA
ncbi:ABC transporter substrate-binding protein [Brachybacterium saurashtrense]|uniref:ABC transporter substrate-binding protein n=1 Tax=Brachybacterium saurashtrense TaxID=556288 RepID=A0A345YNC8_9MICO|nr:ABC transporter substrate-binding protein [Brachybacterium saurashtrense]AXK45430.1 ABC transporter substrate-binding protein [Brachybacterium saurashtrense]RRR21197.1 ABC transporter substrate-binding protein [Brachybacterium saurashtrense]